ncbi:MAG: adenylosuccinate synthase [Spirochaetota bacterium]
MGSIAVIGAQWGDEGKGKIVHRLSGQADVVCRYQGGNNAGHTVVTGGNKYVLHLIPSGILKPDTVCIIGNGVVVNPLAFKEEVETLKRSGISCDSRLFVSERATIIMPYHLELDAAHEESLGIGTTRRGIGPAYTHKYARIGLRACDLLDERSLERVLERTLEEVNGELAGRFGRGRLEQEQVLSTAREYADILRPYVADTSLLVNGNLNQEKRIIFEGAQGVLLDVDFGTYPFVTSSNPSTGGVLTGLGVGPRSVGTVLGIMKAYTTRVGEGPFPTELQEDTGARIRERGGEFGASTGRPRRCGWFDAVATAYAVRVSGIDRLAMTKLDVLDGLDPIRVCTAYRIDGSRTDRFPPGADMLARARPVYEELEGWERVSGITRFDRLPPSVKRYVRYLEQLLGRPVDIISTGSDENETIVRSEPWPCRS